MKRYSTTMKNLVSVLSRAHTLLNRASLQAFANSLLRLMTYFDD